MKKTMKKLLSHVIALSLVIANAMTLTVAPSMAEEAGNVETGLVIEKTIYPTDYAFAGNETSIKANANRVLVNTSIITREGSNNAKYDAFGDSKRIQLYNMYYYPAFEIEDAYAISDIKLNALRHEGSANIGVGYLISNEFLLEGIESGEFYDTDDSDLYETVRGYYSGDNQIMTELGKVSVFDENNMGVMDVSDDVISQLAAAEENNEKVVLNLCLKGLGSVAVRPATVCLAITYDMTKITDKYNADLAEIESTGDVKALVEEYNEYIGADLSQLKNMDVVYAKLFENISNGTTYSFDTLKTAIDDIASEYIYVVEYDKPTDFYVYKRNGSLDGAFTEDLMLVNTSYLQIASSGKYTDKAFGSLWMDSYALVPILSYNIYNPQAISNVEFTTSARRRSQNDKSAGSTDYSTPVGWNVSDADLTDAKAGRYFDDTESTTDVFDTLKAWYDTNKDLNTTEYKVPSAEEFLADETTTNTTTMEIPEAVITQIQEKTAPTKLIITFSQTKRHLTTGIDNNILSITYDLSAVNEADKEFIVDGYNKYTHSTDKLSLIDDGARVELVQMKKSVPSASKAVIAVYNDGVLVKTGIADVTAPGFMKKTVLDLTGFSDVTYDELKVMTWDGLSEMKPLAASFEIR